MAQGGESLRYHLIVSPYRKGEYLRTIAECRRLSEALTISEDSKTALISACDGIVRCFNPHFIHFRYSIFNRSGAADPMKKSARQQFCG